MKPTGALWLALVLAASNIGRAAAGDDTPNYLRDVRMTHDIASLDVSRALGPASGTWAVLRLAPDRFNDGELAQLEPAYKNAPRETAIPVPCVAEVVAALNGDLPAGKWACFCEAPRPPSIQSTPLLERYWIPQSPETVIARVDMHGGFDRPRIDEAYLVPTPWGEKVKPALTFLAANRIDFDDAKAGARRLRPMLFDANPVVSITAANVLAKAGALRAEDVPAEYAKAADLVGTVIDFDLLHYSPEASFPKNIALLSPLIASAKTPEELRGIALACCLDLATTAIARTRAWPPSIRLLLNIRARSIELAGTGNPDAYVQGASEIADLWKHRYEFRDRVIQEHLTATRQGAQ